MINLNYRLFIDVYQVDNVLDTCDHTITRYELREGRVNPWKIIHQGAYAPEGFEDWNDLVEALISDPTGYHPETWCEYRFSISKRFGGVFSNKFDSYSPEEVQRNLVEFVARLYISPKEVSHVLELL